MENEILEGEIYEIIYQNEENGYTVCDVNCNNSLITACGHMPFIAPGEGVKLTGKWVNHPEYGEQFSVDTAERALPRKTSAILAYLSSGIISGVRESTAKKIIDKFGEDSLDVIALEPEKLVQIRGISPMRAKKISESFIIRRDAAQTVIFLQEYAVSPAVALRVHKRFGQAAIELIKENPYILCDNIERIGFKTADRIASEMHIAHNHKGRIASGIKYALGQAALSGHTCFEREMLINYCVKLLGCEYTEICGVFNTLKENAQIILENDFAFLPLYYNMERSAANHLKEIMEFSAPVSKALDFEISEYSAALGIDLSPMQEEAVRKANECGALVITGGPGTGKTTIMKIILEIFKRKHLSIALCAPTGKAAKRLTQSCGDEAKTLHRLLEVQPTESEENQRFSRNETNPLDADVVIVDEMSMVDILLFGALLKALKRGARLIMAGDADQLPSVGAGNVLHDIIASGAVPCVRLNEVFRQAGESRIVTNAHRINNGLMPLENDSSTDFFFMPRTNDNISDTICELCSGRLRKAYGFDNISDIQVLTPSRKGISGTINLNKILQAKLNPPSKNKKEKKFGERIFRVGDKVIQTKNDYDMIWSLPDGSGEGIGIYNGDIGTILDISNRDKTLTISFDEKRIVEYDFASVDELEIAYALTVHKSQGSEWSAVIIPAASFPPPLMTRNLLYTAVTRAKKLVLIVGSADCVKRMVNNNHVQVRYSSLERRLRE